MSEEPLPPSVAELLADTAKARARYPVGRPHTWRKSRAQISFFSRILGPTPPDTPSASFYRIYEFFVLGWNIAFRNELEYFCCSHPEWALSALPDPADADPMRYAILAVLARLLCESFNRRADFGLPRDAPAIILDFEELQSRPRVREEVPGWAERVPPLPEMVFIPTADRQKLAVDDEDVSEEFKVMNIIAPTPHIHFV